MKFHRRWPKEELIRFCWQSGAFCGFWVTIQGPDSQKILG